MSGSEEIRISVVIAAYNAAATIVRAVESCLRQTVLPLEIIVVDDKSSDTTAEILQQYGNTVTVIALKENSGPAAARNAGIEKASGNFIAFLDADDYWLPEKIERVTHLFMERPDVTFLYHDYAVRRSGDRQPFAPNLETGRNTHNPIDLKAVRFFKMLLRNPMATPCVVVKKQDSLRFDEKLRYMEDYELWLRLAEVQKIWHLPLTLTILGRPVLSEGGQSSNRWAMRRGELKVYTRLALRKKWLLPLLPVLWTYSLTKHLAKKLKPS